MMAFAEKGKYNYSSNPTFLSSSDSNLSISKAKIYAEKPKKIKNITETKFANFQMPFKSTTYITKVGIYDENKNLIAVASLANPVKKTSDRDYLIKMRLDF